MSMERIPIESTNIRAIGFDPATCTLEIEFTTGAVYQYQGVSQDDFDALMQASSKGRHFHAHIKNKFPFTKA